MPRLARSFIAQAHNEHRFLPLLLRAVRDLPSARLELRWLKEHVEAGRNTDLTDDRDAAKQLSRLVRRRARGEPLQYLLGSEYFGQTNLCSEYNMADNVRPETASSVLYLLKRLPQLGCNLPANPRILDLCTGSGCMSLLAATAYPYEEALSDSLDILGVDISRRAIDLARCNRYKILREVASSTTHPYSARSHELVHRSLEASSFSRANILDSAYSSEVGKSLRLDNILEKLSIPHFDILISNPPYISPGAFSTQTTRSVRNFEPRLALVPPSPPGSAAVVQGDMFYPRLLEIAQQTRAKILLFEVSDMAQARRVAASALEGRWPRVEIWRDEPDVNTAEMHDYGGSELGVILRGRGDGRSVFCYNPDVP